MKVVCALIIQNKKILLAQRPLHKHHGGYWEFPGGKVNEGESLESALQRELQEELSLKISTPQPLGPVIHQGIELYSFLTTPLSPFTPHEHRAVAWVPVEHLSKYQLCPTDQIAIKAYRKEILIFFDHVSFSSKMAPVNKTKS